MAAGKLANHPGMHQHLAPFQLCRQKGITAAQVIHPQGGVYPNHGSLRRRGMGRRSGSLPPGVASLTLNPAIKSINSP
jgi:hypothetical protein